jgi:hypothetical protein
VEFSVIKYEKLECKQKTTERIMLGSTNFFVLYQINILFWHKK